MSPGELQYDMSLYAEIYPQNSQRAKAAEVCNANGMQRPHTATPLKKIFQIGKCSFLIGCMVVKVVIDNAKHRAVNELQCFCLMDFQEQSRSR